MSLLLYSLLRLAVLAAALGLGYLLGLRSWLLVLVAVVLSAAASYLLLRRSRDAAVRVLAAGAGRRGTSHARDVDTEHEDAADDAARRLARPPSERQRPTEDEAVGELEDAGVPQDEHEVAPGAPADHPPGEAPGRDG